MQREGDRHMCKRWKRHSLSQRRGWWGRNDGRIHRTWQNTKLTEMSSLVKLQTVLWEHKEKKGHWNWKMRRLLVRNATWTGPRKSRGHPNRWTHGDKDIDVGEHRSPGRMVMGWEEGWNSRPEGPTGVAECHEKLHPRQWKVFFGRVFFLIM